MIDLVKSNPFRILGVYADASIKEITSNKTKLLAYAKVNKQLEFNSDCTSLLGAVDRTVASVTEAERELTLPENKIKYALFWFINDGPINSVALSNIQEGSSYNVIKAMDILLKKPSFGSWINLATLSLIQGDVENVINCILRFLTNKSYCLQFSTAICGDSFKIAPERLWDLYTDKLQESVSWYRILQHVKESEHESFCKQFEDKCVETVISQIQEEISYYKTDKGASAEELYFAGMRLHEETRSLVALIKAELDTSDVRIKSILDKLADTILQNSIDFYRASKDEFAAYKALELQMYAEGIAVGEMTKSRCKHNYETLTKIIKRLPSKQVRKEWASIHKFADEAKDCITALRFLKKCSDILVCAKEEYGKNNEDYIRLSTEVANIALNKVIDNINTLLADLKDPFKEFVAISSIQSTLPRAWEVIKSIESLDLSKEFVEDRLQNNKKTLSDMMSKLNVYVGHIHSCIDIRTDDEVFESCKTIGDYEDYCKRFPKGKHHKEAQDKIREHMEQEKKRKRNTWMWVFIIAAAILGFIIWISVTADDRAYENAQNSKYALTNYLNSWPEGKHRDEAISDLYTICEKEGLASFYKFSQDYSTHPKAIEAKRKVDAICDSLYNIAKAKKTLNGWDDYAAAVPAKYHRDCEKKKQEICDRLYRIADSKHTLEAWDEYAAKVPYKYQKDYEKKKQAIREEIERKKWRTESTAWKAASNANTIDLYNKYLEFHPYGAHASQARKRIIDLRVSNVLAGNYGSLPEMDRTYYGGGSSSSITVHNDTGYTLTLLYSGSYQSKEIIIRAGDYETFTLANGSYRVVASVNAARVSNYAGNEQLSGGGYEVTYYIVTQRF